MTETTADLKDLMPTEKSMWRTAEEWPMSDLTQVLWLERRQGKKNLLLQKQKGKGEVAPGASEKAEKKRADTKKKDGENHKMTFPRKGKEQGITKNHGFAKSSQMHGLDLKSKQLPEVSNNYSKDDLSKSDLDIKDAIALESAQPNSFGQQSSIEPMMQDPVLNSWKVSLLREMSRKMPDSAYEQKLKSLPETGTKSKRETAKMLKPEDVLNCRYLRLSKSNIRTLVKLCKDSGMSVDFHPHMMEDEIDSKMVFHLAPPAGSPFSAPECPAD